MFTFTSLDSLFPYRDRGIKKIQTKIGGLLSSLISLMVSLRTPKVRSDEDRRKASRRERERRGYNRHRLTSHLDHKRYPFKAINANGVEDAANALLNIVIVHGLRGYGWLYEIFAEFLRRLNFNVLIIDLPAHGDSVGAKCHIYDMREVNACIESAVVEVSAYRETPEDTHIRTPVVSKIVFIDFSMGASYVLHYLMFSAPRHIKSRVIGVACLGMPLNVAEDVSLKKALFSLASAAWCGIVKFFSAACTDPAKKEVADWKIYAAPILGKYFPGFLITELSMDKGNINHDPKVVEEIWNDRKIYKGPLPAGTASLILQITREVLDYIKDEGYERLPFAVRFFRGEFDGVAKKEHYEKAGIPTTDYPGMFHEILKGFGSGVVIQDIVDWIQSVLTAANLKQRSKKAIT